MCAKWVPKLWMLSEKGRIFDKTKWAKSEGAKSEGAKSEFPQITVSSMELFFKFLCIMNHVPGNFMSECRSWDFDRHKYIAIHFESRRDLTKLRTCPDVWSALRVENWGEIWKPLRNMLISRDLWLIDWLILKIHVCWSGSRNRVDRTFLFRKRERVCRISAEPRSRPSVWRFWW